MIMTSAAAMPLGFPDGSLSAQSTFRTIMAAMARPGKTRRVTTSTGCPAPLMRGTAALALTLFDQDTPIWLDERIAAAPQVADWIRFHSGAPMTSDPSQCSFALCADAAMLPSPDQLAWGTAEYPDRSTTVILQTASLEDGRICRISGPGIDGFETLRASIDLNTQIAANAVRFPRGIDFILVADAAVVAIPRSARLAPSES